MPCSSSGLSFTYLLLCSRVHHRNTDGSPNGSDNGVGGVGGSTYDSDSVHSRASDRPRLTEAHFGIKRLMDDLGILGLRILYSA